MRFVLLVAGLAVLVVGACKPKDAPAPAPSATSVSAAASAAAPALARGDVAPAFSLQGSDGKPHALSDHAGKQAVVIAWFPKAFTGG
jgi:hypothetical protein